MLSPGLTRPPSGRRVRWGLLPLVLGLGLTAFFGTRLLDAAYTREWSEWPRLFWVLGLIACTFIGVAAIVEFGLSLLRPVGKPLRLVRFAVLASVVFAGYLVFARALEHATGFPTERTLVIGLGLYFIICTALKPSWYWDHPQAEWHRRMIGDLATQIIYYLIGIGVIAFALLASHPLA